MDRRRQAAQLEVHEVSGHRTARISVYTHRWLGIFGGILFIVWFASGIVMMYARMPALDPHERLARLPAILPASLRVPPTAEGGVSRLTIGMLGDRPVYRVLEARRWRTVFADDGKNVGELSQDAALQIAASFAPEHRATMRYDDRLTDADQWTFGVRGLMPMHRILLGDDPDTNVYVSDQTAEVVQKTTRSERRWGFFGAVLHWIYFTPFRRRAVLWNQSIVWLSIAGTLMALTGFLWGLWRYSPSMSYRLKRQRSHTPYAGLSRWHHYAGILFGATTITWVFSGLLSMDPWDWHPGTAPTRAQREAVTGGPFALEELSVSRLSAAIGAFGSPGPKEIEISRFRGTTYLRAEAGLVSVSAPERGVTPGVDLAALEGTARAAMPGVDVSELTWMDRYDAYYYDRDGQLSLPVLRVKYRDPQQTWLYLDPKRGAAVRKEERLSRVNRWLYHGLHSFDFPFLYYRRPLWDIVVILFSVGGIVLSATTMVAAWRRLRRHAKSAIARVSS